MDSLLGLEGRGVSGRGRWQEEFVGMRRRGRVFVLG